MKKKIFRQVFLSTILFIGIISPLLAQTIDDVFLPETPITYLGIDFSEARYLGDPGTVSREEMKVMTLKINYLIIAEPEKFDLRKTFSKNTVKPNLSLTTRINDHIDPDKIISYNYDDYNRLTADSIKEIISRYKLEDAKGVGLVFIMEGMNKTAEEAAMWVTFINMADGTVLFTKRVTGRAQGITFRNHWTGAVYSGLKGIYSKEYKQWQKPYTQKKGK